MSTHTSNLLKQRLQRVHSVIGISISLLMYVAVFFGIIAIFLPFLQVWEKPSRHFKITDITQINYSAIVDPIITNPHYSNNNITIKLPGEGGDPSLVISHELVKSIFFNPTTQKQIKDEGEQSQLAMFLNDMHYGRPLKTLGFIIFGLIGVGGMFLIIGGLLQVILLKYSNKGNTPQGSFSKFHRKILTWTALPFITIILTGSLMNIGYLSSGPMVYFISHGETTEVKQIVVPVLFPTQKFVQRNDVSAKMLSLNTLIKKAKNINPEIDFQKLILVNWYDINAQITLVGYNPFMPFLNGIYNEPSIILSGVDGTLIKNTTVLDAHWAAISIDSIYFIHLLFSVNIYTRIIVALFMGATAIALGLGVMLWLEKRAKKFDRKNHFYHWMGKLSLATMLGVVPATGLFFSLQWLLPFDLDERLLWQKGSFFIAWLATLAWSFYRVNSFKTAKEFLFIGGILFISAALSHMIIGQWSPLKLFNEGMLNILGVDIVLIGGGILLLFGALKIPLNRDTAKKLWSHNKN